MLLDILYACPLVAESLRGRLAAKALDEVGRDARDVRREVQHVDALQDDVVRLHGVARGEGRPGGINY